MKVAHRHQKKLPPTVDAAIAALPDTFPEFCKQVTLMTEGGLAPFSLVPWQLDFSSLILERLANQKASLSVMKSRQIGNTLLLLLIELWLCAHCPRFKVLVLDRTERDAHEHARELRIIIKQMGIELVTDNLSLLQFDNGAQMIFRSADPSTCGRGLRSVNIVHIEEQGHQPNLEETLTVTDALRNNAPNSKVILVGTPNGKQMYYYSLLKSIISEAEITRTVEGIRAETIEPYQQFTKNGVDFAFLINWRAMPWLAEKKDPGFLEEKRRSGVITETGILVEYELEFSESESAVFSPVLVRSAEVDLEPIRQSPHTGEIWYEEPDQNVVYYVGGDPNGGSLTSGDAAALVILRQEGDILSPAYIYRKKSGTSSAHVSRWADAIQAFSPLETRVESNNTGLTWIEQLAALCPSQSIEASKTTESTRPQLITLLTLALEREHLKIPKDSHISKELLSFVVNANGKPEAAQGANDDVLFALMHALKASGYKYFGSKK
ncbi:terminase large subunit domain-containing protein [Adonisia turfae]|uniref:terminase large subunit domain-containing protein n=1 Tax=Adonisia turfae TaxID=2950184 RepID=UPI0013D82BF8